MMHSLAALLMFTTMLGGMLPVRHRHPQIKPPIRLRGVVQNVGSPGDGSPPGGGAPPSARPVVFYSDLVSGPGTGGEGNNGVIVTISGKNFGTATGTVTIGGGPVATYKTWTDTKIQVALGSAAATGLIVVQTGGKTSLCANTDVDACSFTVRTGNVHYVAVGGSDSADGSYATPWATLTYTVKNVVAGDTVYIRDGVNISSPDGSGWHAALFINPANGMAEGTAGRPIALVAYPGATVTIGSLTAVTALGDTTIYGLRMVTSRDYVLSGLTLRGPGLAVVTLGGLRNRVINNDISATDTGAVIGGALLVSEGSYSYVYGNTVHDVGTSNKEGHSVYFSTDNNHDWVGWNRLLNNSTCYALQFHSSPIGAGSGNNMYDIHVHDNYISGDRCAGLNLATVDPSKGPVEVYNNVFTHLGTGPALDSTYSYACIYAAGIRNAGPVPSGTVQVFNNTLYDCGSMATNNFGAVEVADQGAGAAVNYNFTNNIIVQPVSSVSPYFILLGATSSYVACASNLFFGAGTAPAYCNTSAVNSDPRFVSSSIPDFHLSAGSPAFAAGASTPAPALDFDGNARSNPQTLGAYAAASISAPPLIAAVHLDISSNGPNSYPVPFPAMDMVCCTAQWQQWESSRGGYNFSPVDAWITRFKAHGSQGIWDWGSEGGIPLWANGKPAGTNADTFAPTDVYVTAACQNVLAGTPATTDCIYKEAVTKFMQHVCGVSSQPSTPLVGKCSIRYYETWNEFNGNGFWGGSYQTLAQMAFDMAKVVRTYCGDCKIVAGSVSAGGDGYNPAGGSPTYSVALADFLARWGGIPGFVPPDAVSFHSYPARTNVIPTPFPETRISHSDTKCTAANVPNAYCRTALRDMAGVVRGLLNAPAIGSWAASLPIWNTEWGYGMNSALTGGNQGETDTLRGAWVSRAMIALHLSDLQVNLAYAYAEPNWMTFFSGGAYTAVQKAWVQTMAWLSNSSSFGPEVDTPVSGQTIYTVSYTHNGAPAQLAWISDWLGSRSYSMPSGMTHAQNLDGVTTTPGATVTLTMRPMLLY